MIACLQGFTRSTNRPLTSSFLGLTYGIDRNMLLVTEAGELWDRGVGVYGFRGFRGLGFRG